MFNYISKVSQPSMCTSDKLKLYVYKSSPVPLIHLNRFEFICLHNPSVQHLSLDTGTCLLYSLSEFYIICEWIFIYLFIYIPVLVFANVFLIDPFMWSSAGSPLFDSSSNFTDPQTMQLLQHTQRLLSNLSAIFHCLLSEAQELTQKGALSTQLHVQLLYFAVVLLKLL